MKHLRCFLLAAVILTFDFASGAETQRLRAALEAEWDYTMEQAPTWASQLGDRRWNDRWPELTAEAHARRAEHTRTWLAELGNFDRAALPAEEQLNLDLAKYEAERDLEGDEFRLWLTPIDQMGGVQSADDLADALRFERVRDYEDWLGRLHRLPAYVSQTIALMRLGVAEGRTLPKIVLRNVPEQIAKQVVEQPEKSPFFRPFLAIKAEMAALDRERLLRAAQAAIVEEVAPAFAALERFFEQEYLPACPDAVGLWQWPNGEATYAYCARRSTTTDLSPRELHELGLREVARIEQEMDFVQKKVGFAGSRQEFSLSLRTDPKFFYATGEELLAGYRATAKRIDPLLVRLFKTLPRTPYGVEPIPERMASSSPAAYYRQPSADGTRAGTFFANLYLPGSRPKREMMALCLHEAVPGHHLQIALAQEMSGMPKFRRHGGYTAYTEGWGLYAESLGEELGLYEDPYDKFGQLTFEAWRACRLVVDTGMHAFHWSRQQALAYLIEHSAKAPTDAEVEIDRYLAWPGQALAYKVGELKIKELRGEAMKTLGPKWDMRAFHEVVLGSGAVPLDVLERRVHAWTANEQKPR